MQDFVSFAGIIALWLLLSAGLWRFNHWFSRRGRSRLGEDVARIYARAAEAQSVFDTIRTPAGNASDDQEALRLATVALLRRIQDASAFFDAVKAEQQPVCRRLGIAECPPLAEILHMRRDLWAASEIVLAEDLKTLGDAFAEPGSYERFYREAVELLFKAPHDDLIDLRLSMARADAIQFTQDVEDDIRLTSEQERLPTLREAIAFQLAIIRAVPGYARAFRAQVLEAAGQVRAAAQTVRESETVTGALSECSRQFWRVREELPGRLATSLERAATLAHTGRERVAAHYAFLTKAYDLQAKYEEVLRRAPEVTERGRQFITRLELEKRSERLKETSRGVMGEARRLLVKALAHLIAGLQRLQERLAKVEPAPAAGERPVPGRREPPAPAARVADNRPVAPRTFDASRIEPVVKKAGKMARGGFDVLYRVLRLGPMPQQQKPAARPGKADVIPPRPSGKVSPPAGPAGKRSFWPMLDEIHGRGGDQRPAGAGTRPQEVNVPGPSETPPAPRRPSAKGSLSAKLSAVEVVSAGSETPGRPLAAPSVKTASKGVKLKRRG